MNTIERVQKLLQQLQLKNPLKKEKILQIYEKIKMKSFEKGIKSFHLFIISLSVFIILSRGSKYHRISEIISLSCNLLGKYYLVNAVKEENLMDKSVGILLLTILDNYKDNTGILELMINIYLFITCIESFQKQKTEKFIDIQLNTSKFKFG